MLHKNQTVKSKLLLNYIRHAIREVAGDYSMSSTRRMQAPGNIRSGFKTMGSRSTLQDDFLSVEERDKQEQESMPKAAVCFITKGNKVLAVSRGEDMSNMNMPGGTVELGEDPVETAKRELYEETGLEAIELFPIYSRVNNGWLVTTYKVTKFSGSLKGSWEGKPMWEDPEVLKQGAYGDYFADVLESLHGNKIQ